ncbi:MAG: hypothetical protein Q7N50_11175, partial [Armatimonadota bacterium]|nr:hypothetical protein [Armatimonadota bacterium]
HLIGRGEEERCRPQTYLLQLVTSGQANRASGTSHSTRPNQTSQVHQAEPMEISKVPNNTG